MKSLTTIVVAAVHAGASIACAVIAAEVVRDVAARGCDTYKDTHPTAARRAASGTK